MDDMTVKFMALKALYGDDMCKAGWRIVELEKEVKRLKAVLFDYQEKELRSCIEKSLRP